MAKGVNRVFLLGNLGKDPEIRSTQGGTTVATFSLATADRRKVNGEWQDFAEWHNLIAFGRTAEVIRDYCHKGDKLHIEGKIQTRSWDDKQSGEKRYKTEILIDDLTLLGSPQGNGGGTNIDEQNRKNQQRSQQQSYSSHQNDYADAGITDDDIPF